MKEFSFGLTLPLEGTYHKGANKLGQFYKS